MILMSQSRNYEAILQSCDRFFVLCGLAMHYIMDKGFFSKPVESVCIVSFMSMLPH